MLGKLRKKLAGKRGDEVKQTIPPTFNRVMGVGQTERAMSRADRLIQRNNKGASNQQKVIRASSDSAVPLKLDVLGHLTAEEVVRRTSSSIVTEQIMVGTDKEPGEVEYAYWTQRGYYPDNPHKANQDSFGIHSGFAGETRGALFGVYDGHGNDGHSCSQFVKKNLPNFICKYVKQARSAKYWKVLKAKHMKAPAFEPAKWPLLTEIEYQKCCRKAFLACNESMRKNDDVDANLSGTTAVTAQFHANMLTICNVGDSRIVLGHCATHSADDVEEEKEEIGNDSTTTVKSRLTAIPLSYDQTPYRKDERERVRRQGGVIMSVDQMEGQEEMHDNWGDFVFGEVVDVHGDPPRVWKEGKDYPGCAFTRSLGDYMAEEIGVIDEPEILTTRLTTDDEVLVIASDGIFEFMSNQEVIDICSLSESPLLACQSLVETAYDQWLINENRTDDITVIVCFLKCSRSPDTPGTTTDLVDGWKNVHRCKPLSMYSDRLSVAGGGSSVGDTTTVTTDSESVTF